ncbi:polysialyltransferase family glycosyltransferase [Hyphococcus sp.]|uniref:polysialyltransferase family glycosyltransferase n=1 Tax=Hyphococcus sp. TaxID=2038636 RepID=UPI003CCBB051
MTEHIGIVTGLSDFANFLAAYNLTTRNTNREGDILKAVLFGRPKSLPSGMQKEFLEVVCSAFPFIDSFILPPETVLKNRIDFDNATRSRLEKTPAKRIVYGNALHKPFHQYLYTFLKPDEFIFFDNGLSSYWDQPLDIHETFPEIGIPIPACACLGLAPPLQPPNYLKGLTQKSLSLNDFDMAFAGLRSAGKSPRGGWLTETVIFGTSIFRTGHLSWEEERGVYLRLIETLKRRGENNIVFKAHPRATEKPIIFESDGVDVLENSIPVEAFVKPGAAGTAYGIASTSLITFERYFGWKSYRIDAPETRRAVEKKPHRGLAARIEPIIID